MRSNKLCIPESSLRLLLLQESHGGGLMGHFVRDKTFATLSKNYFWPKMLRDVSNLTNRCPTCRKAKSKAQSHGLYMPLPTTFHPWEDINMHFILGLSRTKNGNDPVLVMVDTFSNMAHFIPDNKIDDASHVATFFCSEILKKVHEQTWATIERQVHRLTTKINVNKATMAFHPEDLSWLHLHKDHFAIEHKSKLLPRDEGQFKVLHGDEDFDPRSDLSQGRGDDTVYPRAIPMDPPSPPQVPQGPMTRAHTRAFETEVTSLLALLPYESCETWLLPQASVLCVLRCEGGRF